MHEEIKILIIEDERIWTESISDLLHDFGYTIEGTAASFEQAVSLLNNATYDLALLDINLNNQSSGLELGKMLHDLYRKPFIFITGSVDNRTTSQAMEVSPSAYLVKPFNSTSLIVAIQSAINNFSKNAAAPVSAAPHKDDTFFFVKNGNKYIKTEWKDVVYLRSDKNYTILFNATDNSEHAVRCTLQKTLKHLIPPAFQSNFIQVNRSEALQISYIREIVGEEIRTLHGTFTLTEGYYKDLKHMLRVIS